MRITIDNSFGKMMSGPEHGHLVIHETTVTSRKDLERLIRRLRKIAAGLWDGTNQKPEGNK